MSTKNAGTNRCYDEAANHSKDELCGSLARIPDGDTGEITEVYTAGNNDVQQRRAVVRVIGNADRGEVDVALERLEVGR